MAISRRNKKGLKDFRKTVEVTNKQFSQVMRKTALDAVSKITKATPVDTGTAKGNWHTSINKITKASLPPDRSGAKVLSQSNKALASYEVGDKIFISNQVNYIEDLNDRGSPKQGIPKRFTEKAFDIAVEPIKRVKFNIKRGV